jgi:hypothetical protein
VTSTATARSSPKPPRSRTSTARYEARKRLIEVGLGAKGGSLTAIAPVFAAVAESAVSVLEAEPREPILLSTRASSSTSSVS